MKLKKKFQTFLSYFIYPCSYVYNSMALKAATLVVTFNNVHIVHTVQIFIFRHI